MKTKERILVKALELFNSEGLKEVTLRKIAVALEMSQGNLNYHFKTKGDLVAALYFDLVAHMDREMEKIAQDQALLPLIYESSWVSMKTLYDYRFITKDLYAVLDADPDLKKHYLGLQGLRKQQYMQLFSHMTQQGLMRPEEFEGEYLGLYERMNILGDNWINASILFKGKDQAVVKHYHRLLFEMVYPYLTEEGKKVYIKQTS
ncbi:TetR/AcrR family transcriptional regulator [Croceimicrobium sp.]|uniref:TetR/AcrR family transcriptional regulator n=1 Tax=Croceimicrobium sp. TaxID=2828340 RepID=UPI003BAA2E23